jgi:excinuclease ABC subunit A
MSNVSARPVIRLRGVRHNNLKNFDLDLPLNQLIVFTGLSGSGKSSLAFDTLFAEGQRRYIETFSPYARQFFDRMDKPQVESVEGIPPAIAIEQRNTVKTTRSTVGTLTEICDYMRMLWPHLARLYCRQCGQPVRKESPQQIWESLIAALASDSAVRPSGCEILITFDLPLTEKLSLSESLALVSKQGYQRLVVGGQVLRIEEAAAEITRHVTRSTSLTVVQDRLRLGSANRARFVEGCEQAYHFGKGKLTTWEIDAPSSIVHPRLFSNRLHCARCDLEYREPSPALFSFNHPVGACPTCRGFGRVISIDYDLALPDRSRTLAQGVVKPWLTGLGAECQADLLRMCRRFEIPTDVPFDKLPRKWQDFVVQGEPGYGKDKEHEWPRAWYGVKGYFRWLESRAYKMHVRVLLSRYRAYTPCPDCHGTRFKPETLLYQVALEPDRRLTLADFYQLPVRDALQFVREVPATRRFGAHDPLGLALNEVNSRLGYLAEVGLGYLTLDRPTRSLSGGETERVNLTTCLGTRLVNTLYVLDEPSVGLHPRDTARLVRILERLRDGGNTVVVVEHEARVIHAADQIVDLGPGHGATGGEVVFQGTYRQILDCAGSLTGQYLSGRKQVPIPPRRLVSSRLPRSRFSALTSAAEAGLALNEAAEAYRVGQKEPRRRRDGGEDSAPALRLTHATKHNLKDLTAEIPLRRLVCITGVSGSGKTTLVREELLPALLAHLKTQSADVGVSDRRREHGEDGEDSTQPEADSAVPTTQAAGLEGSEHLDRVVLVDQSSLGKTPRSNPAVYIGAFDEMREFFAQSDLAKQRGLNASAFSFNSGQGQCERCRGAGFEKIEMQFLSDVYIRCPDCDGRRYRAHILEVKISPKPGVTSDQSSVISHPSSVHGSGSSLPKPSRRRNAALAGKHETRNTKHGTRTIPQASPPSSLAHRPLSIADLLESTVEEAIDFLSNFPESRPAQRALAGLRLLEEVGLGYLALGQPINTLSGGESQRLKLVRHLAEVTLARPPELGGVQALVRSTAHGISPAQHATRNTRHTTPDTLDATREAREVGNPSPQQPKPILFLFDEPTTGLHFDDVRVLLQVFQRLVNAGQSVLVIEHNLELIKCADWIIDLGPEAGDQGGEIVAQGTPEQIAACPQSHTGRALRAVLVTRGLPS